MGPVMEKMLNLYIPWYSLDRLWLLGLTPVSAKPYEAW